MIEYQECKSLEEAIQLGSQLKEGQLKSLRIYAEISGVCHEHKQLDAYVEIRPPTTLTFTLYHATTTSTLILPASYTNSQFQQESGGSSYQLIESMLKTAAQRRSALEIEGSLMYDKKLLFEPQLVFLVHRLKFVQPETIIISREKR